MPKKISGPSGFTLLELMIVIAIIGILTAIAIPQFARMAEKSKEAGTKGNLATLRSALAIYFGDNESVFPADDLTPSLVTSQKYLVVIPPAQLPQTPDDVGHSDSSAVQAGAPPDSVTDAGGWSYDNQGESDPLWGTIIVNCSHQDLSGNYWTSF